MSINIQVNESVTQDSIIKIEPLKMIKSMEFIQKI